MSEDDGEKGTNFIIGPVDARCCAECFRAVLSFKTRIPREQRFRV